MQTQQITKINVQGTDFEVADSVFRSMLGDGETGIVVTPQMFGALADGVTDDSQAILDAIAALPKKNGILYFPPGVYIHGDGESTSTGTGISYADKTGDKKDDHEPNITPIKNQKGETTRYDVVVTGGNSNPMDIKDAGRDIRFYFDDYTNLTILGYGAEIRSNDKNGQNRNNAMFMFTNCAGVTIKGLKLDGRRQERHVVQTDFIPGPINEFLQCNITFAYGSRDILIEDVTSINSVHDGISIGWTVDNVKIINCVCDNAQRNGIAICGCKNVVIDGCQCNDNGVSGDGYRGIAPKCGIDIEGHIEGLPNVNVHVSNCTFKNSVTQGLCIARWANNVAVDSCYFENNQVVVYDPTRIKSADESKNGTIVSDLSKLTDEILDREVENTYIANCTLINSPLNTQFTLAENNYIESHYIPENPYLTNGYSYDHYQNRYDTEYVCRNNTFKFIVDDETKITRKLISGIETPTPGTKSYEGPYMGIRLSNAISNGAKVKFIGNKVIGAFSVDDGLCAIMLYNTYCKDNVFECIYKKLNGIKLDDYKVVYTANSIAYAEGSTSCYRENNDFGEYTLNSQKEKNRESATDTSIEKSYAFTLVENHVFKVPLIGKTTIRAKYYGQEEEVVMTQLRGSNVKPEHKLIRRATSSDSGLTGSNNKIMDVYFDSSSGIYLKSKVPHPVFTVRREMDYLATWSPYKNFFTTDLLTDTKTGTAPGTLVDMVEAGKTNAFGDYESRPTGTDINPGTMYYDTTLQRPLYASAGEDYYCNPSTGAVSLEPSLRWLDATGDDLTGFNSFTIDGVTYIAEKRPITYGEDGEPEPWDYINTDGTTGYSIYTQTTFRDWVKSKYNTLGLRVGEGDDGTNTGALIFSADGKKVLHMFDDVNNDKEKEPNGRWLAIHAGYGIHYWDTHKYNDKAANGVYRLQASSGGETNPDYSNVPTWWNGSELVTAPIYKGENNVVGGGGSGGEPEVEI